MYNTNSHGFTILLWNANSLADKIEELRPFVLDNNIDIILVQEPKLNHKSVNISSYSFYHIDRVQNSSLT